MNNDFDFENEDLGFENFDDDFEEFEEFEPNEVQTRTAILSKDNMIALLCVKTASEGGAICRIDPRETQPAVQLYDNPEKALEWFNQSLRTSRENGWQIAYDGLPLQG